MDERLLSTEPKTVFHPRIKKNQTFEPIQMLIEPKCHRYNRKWYRQTFIWGCEFDKQTVFTGEGLYLARIEPSLKESLRINLN